MDFRPTDEHRMIKDMVREFADQSLAPRAGQFDDDHRVADDVLATMGELGLFGMNFPAEKGGAGTDMVSYCIAIEELSRGCASTGVIASVNNSLSGWPLYTYGNEEQHERYLQPMLQGKKLGAYGLTEPNAGSDVVSMATTAQKDGDHYVLNGQKVFITNALSLIHI